MLKFGVPNYTVKKCSNFVVVLLGAMKPLANSGVPECTGAIDKKFKKNETTS